MTNKMMNIFKETLLLQKQNILNTHNAAYANLGAQQLADKLDSATLDCENNVFLELKNVELQLVKNINMALDKIELGTFGECEECQESIEIKRLKALPFSTRCLTCQGLKEKNVKTSNRKVYENALFKREEMLTELLLEN